MKVTYMQARQTCCRHLLDAWIREHCSEAEQLDSDEVFRLTMDSTQEWKGRVAVYAPCLTAEQRMELARGSTLKWRGYIAGMAPDLTSEQRMELARGASPGRKRWVSSMAPNLTVEHRLELYITLPEGGCLDFDE